MMYEKQRYTNTQDLGISYCYIYRKLVPPLLDDVHLLDIYMQLCKITFVNGITMCT